MDGWVVVVGFGEKAEIYPSKSVRDLECRAGESIGMWSSSVPPFLGVRRSWGEEGISYRFSLTSGSGFSSMSRGFVRVFF